MPRAARQPDLYAERRQGVAAVHAAAAVAVGGIADNLRRAQQIVKDAVASLFSSFEDLRGVVEEQQRLLVGMTASGADAREGMAASITSRLLREFVDDVLRVSYGSMVVADQLLTTSERVGAIVDGTKALDRLAGDSHFIALNARIESQRAGEAGMPFDVIANEMRRLATESSKLSARIGREVSACAESLRSSQDATQALASHDLTTAIESNAALLKSLQDLDGISRSVELGLQRVSKSVGDAVRALQFEDMVTQLLGDTSARVREVCDLLCGAVTALAIDDGGAASLDDIAHSLTGLNSAGPVAQASVDVGSVELF